MVNLLSITSVLSTVGSIVLALLVLLIMITVHEFGHYVAGKIFKFKKQKTYYSLMGTASFTSDDI